ncbi:hypothetical protein GCM10010358_75670 [Streptomyces minutiscleroticus]|uniref:Uncharacterized protein n=1 Tax=Streptomyces minutiscleroticus TaxID=68238 RepID=A0A918P1F2_9ACTN|nr:hypothetical protein [Streptomyces minutiscleroticus]GGY12091.1 hypothetical protein GCM10010358_75670 [Streptomyces minutiscleroticus]
MSGAQISVVVRGVVADQAPEELDTAEALLQQDNAEVMRVLSYKNKDSELGFGLGEVAVLVTPLVWLVLQQFAQELAGASARTATSRLAALWNRLRGRQSETVAALPPLKDAHYDKLYNIVKERAREAGMDTKAAENLAASVISHIARNQ